ncbi:type IV pilus modification PilV family protein [Solibacillus sp. FSL K6-1126]|uniref:type IV pilus modification PilV family protein n=1 Tax=Solibacillus sp. FSL K6-1126 TaxID=2921463 RepID=UPI0030F87EC8
MRLLKEERGISLVEVVASIVLITVILLSFFSLFLQSKKTHVASESIIDATYVAQQEMEELYGFILDRNDSWFKDSANTTITLPNSNMKFTYTTECGKDCKKFVYIYSDSNGVSKYNEKHWIQLENKSNKLVHVFINVPKKNSSSPVKMESIFRWGN